VAGGLRFPNAAHAATDVGSGDPLAVLRAVPTLAQRDGTALLLLHNFHKFLGNPEVTQTTFAQLIAGKQQRTFLVVMAPVVQVPVELEKLFVVLEHALPAIPASSAPEAQRTSRRSSPGSASSAA
jgi:hypothetical protein